MIRKLYDWWVAEKPAYVSGEVVGWWIRREALRSSEDL